MTGRWVSILCVSAVVACGPTTAASTGAEEGGQEQVDLTDDPTRARAFQAPLDIFARPIDSALLDIAQGGDPTEAFTLDDAESFGALQVEGIEQIELGELAIVIRAVKDRGPPESERWEQTTLEVTAVRAGGVFRLTALHTELRRGASAPEEAGAVPTPWVELRDALLDGFAGPSCRFLPRLREADLSGLYDEAAIAALVEGMPDQARVDRTCADLWDWTPRIRSLEITRAVIHRVDGDRRVVARYATEIRAVDGAIAFGPLRPEED